MDMVMALALVAGVLVAVFVKLSAWASMFWYVGLIGWACFIAAGGKLNGVKRAAVAGIAGMFWVAAAEATSFITGRMDLEWLFVGIAAFMIVIASKLKWFSFLPAGLAGAAVIGAGGPIGIFDAVINSKLAIAFVLGTVVGYIAEILAGMMTKKA